jgi:hypothetical protein
VNKPWPPIWLGDPVATSPSVLICINSTEQPNASKTCFTQVLCHIANLLPRVPSRIVGEDVICKKNSHTMNKEQKPSHSLNLGDQIR